MSAPGAPAPTPERGRGAAAGGDAKGTNEMIVVDSVTISQVQMGQGAAMEDVQDELDRQLRKWGVQSHPPMYWVGILGEEFGEACKEAIEMGITKSEEEGRRLLMAELSHVAAVAIAALECLQRTIADGPA